MQAVEITPGERHGRLLIIETARTPAGRRAALCRCDCGTVKTVDLAHLRGGHTRSCGCLRDETAADNARTNPLLAEYRRSDLRREQSKTIATRHGVARHPHYDRWHKMIERCTNPEYPGYRLYGARGISVHPDWLDPAAFIAWLDANLGPCPPGMSMDRIDNDGNYEPGNIRWATPAVQSRNRRPSGDWRRRTSSPK